jgi:hypothetical protein
MDLFSHILYLTSSSAISRFGDSSNIRSRFPASGTAKSIFAGSSNYSTHKTTYSNYTISGHLRSIDYRNISSNAKQGQNISLSGNKYTWTYKSILDSGVKWYAAYKHSANTGIHSFNIANYITSTTAINRFYPSTTGKATSGSVAKLWTWSSNKSWYANSSNVRFRFPGSSTAISKFLASSAFKRNNWNSHTWLNSGIIWDESLSAWKPKKSGSTGGIDVAWSGAQQFYAVSSLVKAFSSNSRVIFVESGLSKINELADVDTVSTSPTRDQVLKWNVTQWVPAAYNATFVFSIASFSDGESTTQLIGTGVWKAQNTMAFTATYTNGPPTTTWITVGYNTTTYSKSGTVGEMTGPNYTAGTNSTKLISYPAAKDYYVRFRLSAQAGTDTDTETETAVYFRNYTYYGKLTKNLSISEADIETLTGTLSGTPAGTYSINAGAGEYIVLAYPATYTSVPSGNDYEDCGGTGFLFNSIACAFSGHAYVSVTNSAGYTENYKVYASNLPNLGNHSLVTTTTTATINTIYYGVLAKAGTFTESDVESLSESSTTNTYDGTIWTTITAGVGEYLIFAFPKRWGEKGTAYTFYDNATGFEAAFLSAETVSITNSNGWSEDFYVYRSENANLGAVTIRSD